MTEAPATPPTDASEGTLAQTEAPSIAPALAPGQTPLCFLVDEEPSIRHFISLVLHGIGVDTQEFPDGAAMRKAKAKRPPDVIFHNISLESADAISSVIALGKNRFEGAIQLMSNRGAAVLEHVKGIGIEHKLNMLPTLKKPFETEAIAEIMRGLNLGIPVSVASRIDLDEALEKKWIEFWYQPKIDMRKKQLAGAEACVRAHHPQHGVVKPESFLPGAPEPALIKLSELALESALKAGLGFSKIGINLRLSVNVPLTVLAKLPIADIVRAHRPNGNSWAGLIVDVPEEEGLSEIALARELAKKLEGSNVRLALDECGRSYAALETIENPPFAEFKLDCSFVTDCGSDRVNAPLCKQMIDLAHQFGRSAVGVGIDKATDASALVSMGCDFGQGFLLGQPMPEDRFVSLLRQRAATQGRKLAPAR